MTFPRHRLSVSLVCCVLLLAAPSVAETSQSHSQPDAVTTDPIEMTNLEIIKSTYEEATSEENAANLKQHVVPDIEWTEAAGFPYAGTYVGLDQVIENVFERLASEWIDYRITVEGYVADGDHVVAFGTYSGVHAVSGNSLEARVAHLWTLRDGKILRFEQFVDSKPVHDAMLAD